MSEQRRQQKPLGACPSCSETTKSPYVFGIVFQTQKTGKTSAKAPPQTIQIDIGIRKNDFSEKLIYAMRMTMCMQVNYDNDNLQVCPLENN